MCWSSEPVLLASVLLNGSNIWYVSLLHLQIYLLPNRRSLTFFVLQDSVSWLIVDSNETPGGLASTDITPEGFVSIIYSDALLSSDETYGDCFYSYLTLADTSSSPITSTSTTA